MQGMEVSAVSHTPKMLCCHKMSQKMEILSNFQQKNLRCKFDAMASAQYFRSISQRNYQHSR